ncbi:MAG: MCE family protein [Deltaproteobacteria bacterium]|nr:MCE family protein [Deltaproteobacteria bacterium]
MSRRANPTAIGLFVLGAVALAVVGIAMFGSGLLARPKATFILYFPESVNGLDVGAPVKFKGVQLGRVTRIVLGYDQKPGTSDVAVLIEIDEKTYAEKTSRIVDLANREVMKEAIDHGLRARLETQSLVTGLLYIELGFFPDTSVRYMQLGDTYTEIPTIPSNLEEIVDRTMGAIARIGQIPLEDLVQSFTSLARNMDGLVQDPKLRDAIVAIDGAAREAQSLMRAVGGEVKPLTRGASMTVEEARETLIELRRLAESVQSLTRDGSPLRYQLSTALGELTNAARSLRVLADYLERDPQAILTGKNGAEP